MLEARVARTGEGRPRERRGRADGVRRPASVDTAHPTLPRGDARTRSGQPITSGRRVRGRPGRARGDQAPELIRAGGHLGIEPSGDRLEAAFAELAAAIREELRAVTAPADGPARLLSVEEAADLIGCGKTRLYEEIARGRLQTLKIGRRRLVSSTALRDYVERAADQPPRT